MYYQAFGEKGIYTIDNNPVKESIEILQLAIENMRNNPDYYKTMNPPNGWGDYEGALKVLTDLLDACKTNARSKIATVIIS
jgi:hypothetical protein